MRYTLHLRSLQIGFCIALFMAMASGLAFGQTNSSVVRGTVTDKTGAVIPGASVTLTNPVSGFLRNTTSDATGDFTFYNVPFDGYSIAASATGFGRNRANINVVSSVQVTAQIQLSPLATQTVTVTASASDAEGPLSETSPTYHTDVDRTTIDRLPIESPSSALSSIITLASPGVAADSNGLLHGLGDHNEDSFSVDGEPISDQQSKVFSNQLPAAAVQGLQVIDGAPPVEYGDKTSLVIAVTTRSGQGVLEPTGAVSFSFGAFGSSHLAINEAQGGEKWGNFIAADGLQTGRFLDAPEFSVFHDKGNEENLFDRADFNVGAHDSLHLNFQYTRSWFQTPNDYENFDITDQFGNPVGTTDQRSKIGTVNFSPTYTHVIGSNAVANFGLFLRRDAYNYYPSNNPLADYAVDQQQESISQARSLTSVGARSDVTYLLGMNTVKFGGVYQQTFLRENDNVGIVDPGLVAGCGQTNCAAILAPYDLTARGNFYHWSGATDVKELALYGEDTLTRGNFTANFGLRGDFYNGLTVQHEAEPRGGVSYHLTRSGTVLRASYARTQETPFNENLVLSSTGCADPVLFNIFATLSAGSCSTEGVTPFNPGFRNEFHAGFSQSAGRHLLVTLEYLTKYTHNAYDFSVLGTTPITFPIEWHNSKIPGYAGSAVLTNLKGLSVRFNASSVSARFFNPQIGGVGSTPNIPGSNLPFRIDHDEHFNETTHLEYAMPFRKSMYYAFNWRYDSGLVAGASPCFNVTDPNSICNPANGGPSFVNNGQNYIDLSYLSPDQQSQAGLTCNGVRATPTRGTGGPVGADSEACLASQLTSNLIAIPAPGTEDDDRHPQRIQPRNVFDMAVGDDKLFHFGADEKYKVSATLTAINMANKYALYNFLSTFSGTHYVTPRAITGEVAFNF